METVYQRAANVSKILDAREYVSDLEGNLYDITNNLVEKTKLINKSLTYWTNELIRQPKNAVASKFVKKFSHLHEQLKLYAESKKVVRKANESGRFEGTYIIQQNK